MSYVRTPSFRSWTPSRSKGSLSRISPDFPLTLHEDFQLLELRLGQQDPPVSEAHLVWPAADVARPNSQVRFLWRCPFVEREVNLVL
jgi:hypothetical protein